MISELNEVFGKPFPNSKKVYVQGALHDIKVGMREIELADTRLTNGEIERNEPVTVYDTSGSFSDQSLSAATKRP